MKKSFLYKKKFYIPAAIALVIIIFAVIKFSGGSGKQLTNVVRSDIVQEVAVTGKIKPNQSVELGFDKSGRVQNVYVSVGEVVKSGQVLASLEAGEVSADLAKARALLDEERVTLLETKNTAPLSFGDASKNLDASIKEGFADADNAVRNRADQFFKNLPDSPRFEISITSGNFVHYFNVPSDTTIVLNNERRKVETILTEWKTRLSSLTSDNLASEADKAITGLNVISDFLDDMAGGVKSFTSADYSYDTTVINYKTAISSARSEVSGAISALVTAKDKYNASGALGSAGQFESVLTQEAKVSQAQAAVDSLESSLGKFVIRAPFDGVITKQDAKQGEAVSASAPLISMISQGDMYIEADISEIHIGKVKIGDPVSITLDAFPNETFVGEVSYIEPGDVIIDGIVNYKVRVNLKNADERIKSGLTSNLKIETDKKENVLSIPLYAVIKEGDQNFVNKVSGNKTKKIPASLGLSGNNGFVEILSGLSQGDVVEF
jgi:RND family efflux transporter MFP subunit